MVGSLKKKICNQPLLQVRQKILRYGELQPSFGLKIKAKQIMETVLAKTDISKFHSTPS